MVSRGVVVARRSFQASVGRGDVDAIYVERVTGLRPREWTNVVVKVRAPSPIFVGAPKGF